MMMKRREAIKQTLLLIGASMSVGSLGLLTSSCGPIKRKDDFTENQRALMDAIAETLIPETDIPGAAAAGVGAYVYMMLMECHGPEDRALVADGLEQVEGKAQDGFRRSFLRLTLADREVVLKKFDVGGGGRRGGGGRNFMGLLKGLVNEGYYTSEIGCKQALNFVFVPGEYRSCIPLEEGQKAWAM